MKISLEDLEKVEFAGTTSLAGNEIDQDETLTAIIRVNEPDYVPQGVDVRSRIDSTILTGSFLAKSLKKLQSDPKVQSVSLSRKLHKIENE
jgi:hypothetical protein